MLQTIADDLWGLPCLAYHVQPGLTLEARAALGELQQAAAECWPVPLHTAPPEALHITIYALVPIKEQFDKDGYWGRIADPCRALLQDLCAGHGPLALEFFRLKVTDTAIIAVARDETGLIETIRRKIAEVIPPPPGRQPMRYDLIHSTIARYPSSEPVPREVVDRVESLPVSISAPVGRMKIIRETIFPCLVMDEIASFPLA